MISSNKSQISIFMIIGLLVIIGGGIFFYATQKVQKPYQPEIKIVQEKIPTQFDPIKNYANDCAYSVGVEGLKIIGKQGGYISLTNKTINKESFAITQNPTESDAVSFTRDSNLKIPYWWYLKSNNNCKGNCEFASKRSDLRSTENSIEKQLERYIDAEFESCLKNFQPFVDKGFKVTRQGTVKSDVTIGTEDILIIVEYPINAESQNTKSDLKQFAVNVPINLEKIYDLSTKITNMEIKYHYLERHILNMIVAFSGVDKEKLPPMSDMQFKFGSSTIWQKRDIKNKVTGLLASYVPLFQVDGTANYDRKIFDKDLQQSLYDSTIIPIANSSFENLESYFTYLDFWPLYFDLNCNGERCVPSSSNSVFSFFGIQDYSFSYDLSFPVLIEVMDPDALHGQGYRFNFFMEGNIRNNKPMPVNFAPLETASLSERSQLCDSRTSGKIKVKVTDAYSKKPIDDAQVLYTLIGETCFISSTNADGTINENFPVGVGGVIDVVKDQYIGKYLEFDPKVDVDDSLNVELQPIQTKKIIIKKKNVVKTPDGWKFNDVAQDLNDKESATTTITRINSEDELEFSSSADYHGQQPAQGEIELALGNYTIDATLLLSDKLVIPEKEKCEGSILGIGRQCYKIPRIDYGEGSSPGQERFVEGGLKLNFTISADDIANHDSIVIYVVSVDLANVPEQDRDIEDLDQVAKIEDYSTKNKDVLKPVFE